MSLLSVQAARQRILDRFQPVGTESIPLDRCAGRVLAQDIVATDLPFFDNSSVDGFAVKAADVKDASPAGPRVLRVVADIPAGSNPTIKLETGQAARIMTGAPLPEGADSVIMVEDTDFSQRTGVPAPAQVLAFKPVKTRENVRARGMDVRKGATVMRPGALLRAQDVGLLAMLGVAQVQVHQRPRVALMSSGDELVAVDRPLEPGKIRDTNTYTLGALVSGAGCDVIGLGVVPDQREPIKGALDHAIELEAQVIVSSAGVSVGALDFVKEIVASEGSLDFWRVNMRPGKPLAFGEYRGVPFVGLPGNPVSAFVGFEVFVRPALARLSGRNMEGLASAHPSIRVRVSEAIESDGRESFLRVIVEEQDGVLSARLTGHQGSGNLLSLVQANALLIIPAGVKSLAIGSQADAWLL